MTLQELKDHLTYFTTTEDEIGIAMYLVLRGDNDREIIRKADINEDTRAVLKEQFLNFLSDKYLQDEEIEMMNLSRADARKNVIYSYDLDQRPPGLEVMNTVLQNEEQEQFSFRQDEFDNLQAFMIMIGNEGRKMVLYKKHYRLNLIHGVSVLNIRISDHRFERVTEDIIKMSPTIDFLQIGNDLVILKLKTLEKGFGFEDAIRHQAAQNIDVIQAANLLEDIAPLTLMAQDLKSARRIMRIRAQSPVLQLPAAAIIDFVTHHPPIMHKFRLSADGARLKLDTKVSQKLFLELLNDDHLTSGLTHLYYVGLAKDPMEVEIAPAP